MKKLLLFLFFTLTHSAIALDKKYFETQMEEPLTQESLSFPSTIVDTSVWRSKDLSEPDMTKAMRVKKIVSSHITGAFGPTYFEDLTKFALYLEENAESILKNKPSLYIHSDGWLRTPLLLYKDKSIYIIFKKMDPKTTKGGYKSFSRSLHFQEETLYANLSLPTPGRYELSKILRELVVMKELQDIPFVLSFHKVAMYEGHSSDAKILRKTAVAKTLGLEQATHTGKKLKLLTYKIAIQTPLFDRDLSNSKYEAFRSESSSSAFKNLKDLVKASLVMVNTLQKIHRKGFMHRDIKPANFFLKETETTPYLADFGLTEHKAWDSFGYSISGSRGYLDPKMCESKLEAECACINFSSAQAFDSYALGLTFFDLLKHLPESQEPITKEYHKRFWEPFHETLYELNLKALPKAGFSSQNEETFTELFEKLEKIYNEHQLSFHERSEKTPHSRYEQIVMEMLHPQPIKRPRLPEISQKLSSLLTLLEL